jgi:signal transduction histidine kinase
MNEAARNETVELSDKRGRFAHLSWRNSYWAVLLTALLIGVLTLAASIALDWAIHGVVRRIYASDLLECVAAFALSGIALLRLQRRRRELLVRMQIIEDVNHHVRNALTAITLSASLYDDTELNERVKDACERIDWVLSDVLSQTVGAGEFDRSNPRWQPGRRLKKK